VEAEQAQLNAAKCSTKQWFYIDVKFNAWSALDWLNALQVSALYPVHWAAPSGQGLPRPLVAIEAPKIEKSLKSPIRVNIMGGGKEL